MAFQLPPLPNASIVDERGYPTAAFAQYWQQLIEALTGALLTLANVTGVVLPGYQDAIRAAKKAADDANKAAALASKAASDAASAQVAAAKEQALVSSYIDPASVLTATPTTITVANHTRYYTDGASVAVTGGTVAATAPGDTNYVSYSDPDRMGGTVSYIASIDAPTQGNDVHVVGAVTIPATGTADGGQGPQRPGYVQAKQPEA